VNAESAPEQEPLQRRERNCPGKASAPFVYLYTTAGGTKLNYRRGILDALCYPNGHIIRYRYRLQEISPEVLSLSNAPNVPAVIIFVDSLPKNETDKELRVNHYPLRLCEISRMPPFADLSTSPPQRRVDLSLKLGDFVYYDGQMGGDQWHQQLAVEDERRKISDSSRRYFVITASDRFRVKNPPLPPSDKWEILTQFVAKSTQMSKAVFLRFGDLMELEESVSHKQVKPYFGGAITAYPVKPAKEYRLDITVFDSPFTATGLGENSELEIKVSSDQVYVSQPFHSVVSGLVERSTILSCKRTTEALFTTMVFSVTGTQPGTTTNSPVLTLRTKPSVWRLVLFVLFVAVGAVTLSVDIDTAKWLWIEWLQHQQDSVGLFVLGLKMMGLLAATSAAFIAYRKLPQPGKD
jgi:hypothetical protein